MANARSRRLAAATVAALAALSSVAAVAPAPDATCRLLDRAGTPDDPADDLRLCESTGWVVRSTSPVGNAGGVVDPSLTPTLSPTAPTGAAPAGSFGGSVTDILLQNDPSHGLEFEGEFTGPVDAVAIVAYVAMPRAQVNNAHGVTVNVSIDGSPVTFGGEIAAQVSPTSTQGVREVRVAVKDLVPLLEDYGISLAEDEVHTLRVNLSPFFVLDDGAYLFDSTATPSRVELNPSASRLAQFTIAS